VNGLMKDFLRISWLFILPCLPKPEISKSKYTTYFTKIGTVGYKKKTGNENFPNVNLILSICQLIVYLTIPIK
jgi:hypothetical protein